MTRPQTGPGTDMVKIEVGLPRDGVAGGDGLWTLITRADQIQGYWSQAPSWGWQGYCSEWNGGHYQVSRVGRIMQPYDT